MNFAQKMALAVFKYSNYLPRCKKSVKTNNPFLIKMPNCWWTDKQTDREPWFYRTLHRTGVQNVKFGRECNCLWEGRNNSKLNPFIKTMVHRSNIHYSKINLKGNWKNHSQFLLELQKMRPPKNVFYTLTYRRHFWSPSFRIHILNITLALTIPICTISQPKMLQINLP